MDAAGRDVSGLSLRPVRPADAARVRALHESAMRDVDALAGPESALAAAAPGEDGLDADLRDVRASYVEGPGEMLVGEVDGHLVAMGAYVPEDDATAEITRMRVHPALQGRGYGSRLLEALERRAREAGYRAFVLDTLARQVAAQHLYESHGYRQVDWASIGEWEVLFYRKAE